MGILKCNETVVCILKCNPVVGIKNCRSGHFKVLRRGGHFKMLRRGGHYKMLRRGGHFKMLHRDGHFKMLRRGGHFKYSAGKNLKFLLITFAHA